ncbi:hypothetical protein K492DRAFT_196690 [Lichtheimia hyalospora FSU 10163]|nr:hypothetical protein K492DRAFT_196690 [Lichtheimia hyalospora FSU 10163]
MSEHNTASPTSVSSSANIAAPSPSPSTLTSSTTLPKKRPIGSKWTSSYMKALVILAVEYNFNFEHVTNDLEGTIYSNQVSNIGDSIAKGFDPEEETEKAEQRGYQEYSLYDLPAMAPWRENHDFELLHIAAMTGSHWETISLFCNKQTPKFLEQRFKIIMKQNMYIDFFNTLLVQTTFTFEPENHGKLWSEKEENQ